MTRNYTNRHAHGWNANNGHYLADERGGGWHPSRKVRLFPNCEKIKFTGKVHELVEPSVEEAGYEIKVANFVIHHYGGLIEKEDRTISKQLAYFQLGKTKLAENPRDLSAIGELAVQAGQLKLFKEAIELWDRFLELRPGANIALFNKGFSLMGLSRFHEAREMASAVLDTEPFHKEAAFNYGTCVLYTGDVNKAIKILEKILIQHAKHPPLLSLQAVLYLAADKLEPARLTVEKLKLLNYDISEYIYDRATVLDSLGRTGLAQKLRNGAASLEMQVKHHHEVTRS
jgi:tetratricopeptide (TPR) repeat protein